MQCVASHFILITYSVVMKKMFLCVRSIKLLVFFKEKTTREIIETKAGLRTVQHVTKTRKDSGETLPSKTLRNKTS